MTFRAWAAGVALCAAISAPAQEPALPYLARLALVNDAHLTLAPGANFRVTLELNDAFRPTLQNALASRGLELTAGDHRLQLTYRGYPRSSDPVTDQHRKPTFLIDYDEPAFEPLRQQLAAAYGSRATPAQLARFVHDYIVNKSYSRGYDLASVVARRKEGDCSEHAVLLAALLRMSGIPARVVHGVLLLPRDGQVLAFGHAWVEQHQGDSWELVDAVAPDNKPPAVYLPLAVVENEGPAFEFKLFGSLGPEHVKQLRLDPAPK